MVQNLIDYANSGVERVAGRPLTETEVVLLRGALEDIEYEKLSAELNHDVQYTRHLGMKLWVFLGYVFDFPEKPSKKKLLRLLEAKILQGSFSPPLERKGYLSQQRVKSRVKVIGKLPQEPYFVKRREVEQELSSLISKSRQLFVYGWSGSGKSLTVAHSLQGIQSHDVVIWQSMNGFTSPEQLLMHLVKTLELSVPGSSGDCLTSLSELFKWMDLHRALLVLDQAEIISQADSSWFNWIEQSRALTTGTICVILQSITPALMGFSTLNSSANVYQIKIFSLAESVQLLSNLGLEPGPHLEKLSRVLGFCPALLIEKARLITSMFDGDVEAYLNYHASGSSPLLAHAVQNFLSLNQPSPCEKMILSRIFNYVTANPQTGLLIQEILAFSGGGEFTNGEVIGAVQSLKQRDILQQQGRQILPRFPALVEILKQTGLYPSPSSLELSVGG